MSIIMDSFEFMEINNQVYYIMWKDNLEHSKPRKRRPPYRNDIYPETFDKGEIKECLTWLRSHRGKKSAYWSLLTFLYKSKKSIKNSI